MVFTPRNLGYSLIVGIAEGGRIDDALHPPLKALLEQKQLLEAMDVRLEDEAKRIEYFDNEDDAFNFLKRAVASGYPVEVHLNAIPVMHDFARASSKWAETSVQYGQSGFTEVSDFLVVTGYDDTYVYLNEPFDPDNPNLPTTIDNFKSAWNVQETLEPNNTGPYWMLFIKKSGERKSIDEILAWNKQRSIITPSEIRLISENPPLELEDYWVKRDIATIANIRSLYSKFLEKNGKPEAAALYEQSSKLWKGLVDSSTISEDIKKIADLEERAQGLY